MGASRTGGAIQGSATAVVTGPASVATIGSSPSRARPRRAAARLGQCLLLDELGTPKTDTAIAAAIAANRSHPAIAGIGTVAAPRTIRRWLASRGRPGARTMRDMMEAPRRRAPDPREAMLLHRVLATAGGATAAAVHDMHLRDVFEANIAVEADALLRPLSRRTVGRRLAAARRRAGAPR